MFASKCFKKVFSLTNFNYLIRYVKLWSTLGSETKIPSTYDAQKRPHLYLHITGPYRSPDLTFAEFFFGRLCNFCKRLLVMVNICSRCNNNITWKYHTKNFQIHMLHALLQLSSSGHREHPEHPVKIENHIFITFYDFGKIYFLSFSSFCVFYYSQEIR